MSKVYVRTDEAGRIVRCEGGYTTPTDLSGWAQIDEGAGDKYNLCQSHYFTGGIYTIDGLSRYKLVDGQPVERSQEELAADRSVLLAATIRTKRNQLLSSTDWTQVPDSPLTDEAREAMRIYRQELRDLPLQKGFPNDVIWPTEVIV